MLTYNGIRIKYVPGSLVIMNREQIQQWHFVGTNKNLNNTVGIEATTISCLAVAENQEDLANLKAAIYSFGEYNLVVYEELYKKASIIGEKRIVPTVPDGSAWEVQLTFSAADPVPYNAETGEVLY